MKTKHQQLKKEVDNMNKKYQEDGSDFRAYLTGDKNYPIGLKKLSEASFSENLKLFKLTRKI